MNESALISDNRQPLTLAAELDALDESEMLEGYLDGFRNEPCGDNRSRAFWHGWRNGMVDGGYANGDSAQAPLAHDHVRRAGQQRKRALDAEPKKIPAAG
jgi:hypothetical protein